jgi:signal transduction histidine kinase
MNITNIKNSLFWRLSATFLLLFILLGLAYTFITSLAANRYFNETTQKLNADVADHLLAEISPFVDGEVNKASLDKLMHSMMAVNPAIEVYLLSPDGEILSYVVLDKKVKLSRVSLEPLDEFIAGGGEQYVLGDDPRNPGHHTIFSATRVEQYGAIQGYVYIVLASEKYEDIAGTLQSSYWLQVGTRSFVIALLAAFVIGLVLIALLTKNLRKIIATVNRFERGDLQARVPEKYTKGELGLLSRNFNKMADSILHNIEELKKVDTLRKELIANVSHDLRNPLAVVHGYIETLLLKEDKLTAEERKKYLNIILNSSEKLRSLVTDLFELSKLEAGQVVVRQESFFIGELLQDAGQKFELMAREKNIKIESELEGQLPMVYADLSMIDRVIQNLLDNAVKYTPSEGWIRLQVTGEPNAVKIDIENSGEGIADRDIPSIFNRYYKVDKEASHVKGTGLGLAIVKRILDLHHSTIEVRSKPHHSTIFSFRLPVHKAA